MRNYCISILIHLGKLSDRKYSCLLEKFKTAPVAIYVGHS